MKKISGVPVLDLPIRMSPLSRVWVYQSSRTFSKQELAEIHMRCDAFVKNWKAHGAALAADYRIFFDRFICLFVDENVGAASGCSIDGSVRMILEIEKNFNLSLTNRMEVAYLHGEELRTVSLHKLPEMLSTGQISKELLVFNNLVANLADMEQGWIIPLRESWHSRQ